MTMRHVVYPLRSQLDRPASPEFADICEIVMTAADIVTAFSAVVAALSFAFGVQAWKREFVGKRRIELAESVLAKFYEAADAIRAIRSPFGRAEEGKSRQRANNETPESSELLDRAYVAFERYQRRSDLFAEIGSMKYRFMAAFGKSTGASFDELRAVVNEIFISAQMLGEVYWPRQGREMSEQAFEIHLRNLQEHEAIFWTTKASDDKITPRVEAILRDIEGVTQLAVGGKRAWRRWVWQRVTGVAAWRPKWRRIGHSRRHAPSAP